MSEHSKPQYWWNLFCLASIVGIWPRFVEPKLLFTTRLALPIRNLPNALRGLKIVQISDLHLNEHASDAYLDKLIKKVDALQPDLIVITGDFLCYAQIQEPIRLRALLKRFKAPHGCYAVLGNHDYANYVSINACGDYDLADSGGSLVAKAFRRLFTSLALTGKVTARAQQTPLHAELPALLDECSFRLLHNTTIPLTIRGTTLNLCGLGEYSFGRTLPQEAFRDYDSRYPGVILLHNPDGVPLLKDYPGDVVLCGHTHGGQVNLPVVWKKLTLMENTKYKKGLVRAQDKWVYVNRGVSSTLAFRCFAPPEILLLTLEVDHEG